MTAEVGWRVDDSQKMAWRVEAVGKRLSHALVGDRPYLTFSDFVAPLEAGVADYVGMFAVSAGLGLEEIVAEHKAANDDYSYIMAEELADRLAEAAAEVLHLEVRREQWGYSKDVDDLLKVKYRGIRSSSTTRRRR